jgi:hypothetical protein
MLIKDDTCVSRGAPDWFHIPASVALGHGERPLVIPGSISYVTRQYGKRYFLMDGADIDSDQGRKRC